MQEGGGAGRGFKSGKVEESVLEKCGFQPRVHNTQVRTKSPPGVQGKLGSSAATR